VYNRIAFQYAFGASPRGYYYHEMLGDLKPLVRPVTDDYNALGNHFAFNNEAGAAFRFRASASTSHFGHDYIKFLIDNDFLVMFAYARFLPTATQRPDGKWDVTFTPGVPHKVAVSGYRPGQAYPIRINNPGTGQQHNVRIVSDFTTRDYGAVGAKGSAIASTNFGGPVSKYMLEFEDGVENNPAPPGHAALVLEQIDATTLTWQAPGKTSSWSGQWGTGWTHFNAFTMNGRPHMIAYNQSTGLLHVDSLSLNGATTRFAGQLNQRTHLMTFTLNNVPHYFGYNTHDGSVLFFAIKLTQQPEMKWGGTWGTGWTHFVPFQKDNQPHFVAYNATTGRLHVDRVSPTLQGAIGILDVQHQAGYENVVVYFLEGAWHIAGYNRENGMMHYHRLTADLKSISQSWATPLDTNSKWTHVVLLESKGVPHLVALDAQPSGFPFRSFALYRIGVGSKFPVAELLWQGMLNNSYNNVMSFSIINSCYELFYDRDSGKVDFFRFVPLG
jgi:hypothetical protein